MAIAASSVVLLGLWGFAFVCAQVYCLTVPGRKGTVDGRKVAPLVAIACCSAGNVAADVCVRPRSPESMLRSGASMAWACYRAHTHPRAEWENSCTILHEQL